MTKKKLLIGLAAVVVIVVLIVLMSGGAKPMYALPDAEDVNARENNYQTYLDQHGYDGSLSGAVVEVDVFTYTASEDAAITPYQNGIDSITVNVEAVDTGDVGSISWPFTVAESGFYNLEVGYIAMPGTTSDIQRRVLIDASAENSEAPYDALEQIVFKRLWRDEDIRLKNGNEIRPNADEVYQAQSVFLEDYDRRSGAPLILYLEAGAHTLTFEAIKEPMAITSLTFRAAPKAASYDETLAAWKQETSVYAGEVIIGQAERRAFDETAVDADGDPRHTALNVKNATVDVIKTSPAITVQKNYSDAALVPFHAWHILYPTIGASSWSLPGDAITLRS